MASGVVWVRLHLLRVCVLAVVSDTLSGLVVEVGSTVTRPRCPHCGFRCGCAHDTRRRRIRGLEVSGRRTTLVWLPRGSRVASAKSDSWWAALLWRGT